MKTVAFYTLGCKVNQYETEAVSELFSDDGFEIVPFEEKADVYIINTCSVTSVSDRKSRRIIRYAKKQNPNAVVAVMGCYSQTSPNEVLDIDGVNLVLGTKNKSSVLNLVKTLDSSSKLNAVMNVADNHEYEELTVSRTQGRTRAYIKIQDGCSQFCSYCIIPYARGPVRSRCEKDVINEISAIADAGYKEIVLTGIHVASYGKDLGNTSLAELLCKADRIEGIKRIRLSSIEPMTLNSDFVETIKNCKKLCPHFHISLQSGCDATLKRMNRHYTAAQFESIVNGLRNAFDDCAVTTDIMTGFAGETDAEFEETLKFVNRIKFADAHVFRYSQRRGTPAARRPDQVAPEVKEERSKIIIDAVLRSRNEFLNSQIGKTVEVLFETHTKDGYYEGKTANYITVHAKSDEDMRGKFRNVYLDSINNGIMFGKTVD